VRLLEVGAVTQEVKTCICSPAFDHDLPTDWRSTVTHWGDFLKAQYCSKSLIPLGGRSSTGEQFGSEKASSLSMTSSFDAFPDGFGMLNDAIEDSFRGQLEACDGVQGLQIISDVNSGFGGLAVEVLQAIREELPRTAAATFLCGETLSHAKPRKAGATDYSDRDRSSMNTMNWATGLHMWARDASDVSALCIPFCLQSAFRSQLNTMTGGNIAIDNSYQTSALLACTLDMFSSPCRRSPEYRGGLLQLSECHYPDSWRSVAKETPHWHASPEAVALHPLASFASIIEGLMPTHEHHLADMALWLPAPVADASPSAYCSALVEFGSSKSKCSWQSMSQFCSFDDGGPDEPQFPDYVPLSHMVVARGVGAMASESGRYLHSLHEYGSATEMYLEHIPCRQAMQCMLRSPLAVPISFPDAITHLDSEGQLPLCIPALALVSVGPRSTLPVQSLLRKFNTRDRSIMYRYAESAHMPSDSELDDSLRTLLELHAPQIDKI
jgi:hypothetical protein